MNDSEEVKKETGREYTRSVSEMVNAMRTNNDGIIGLLTSIYCMDDLFRYRRGGMEAIRNHAEAIIGS